ncbi:hypothetical protein EV421DRAFT_1743249 [Armillaria borealis]|uniref:Uncharacterized protein n=1 Tax=Armillaria borealis TaxID=47425 RepID=A0AA39IWW9_9AGAR|nr:hypothetical protein EV421DRAFT_1743249 [Armillaria borealis]
MPSCFPANFGVLLFGIGQLEGKSSFSSLSGHKVGYDMKGRTHRVSEALNEQEKVMPLCLALLASRRQTVYPCFSSILHTQTPPNNAQETPHGDPQLVKSTTAYSSRQQQKPTSQSLDIKQHLIESKGNDALDYEELGPLMFRWFFAGLFYAVVTIFVVQTSPNLQGQALLFERAAVQAAGLFSSISVAEPTTAQATATSSLTVPARNGSLVPRYTLNLTPFTPHYLIRWSTHESPVMTLFAVLTKQGLLSLRQFRYKGLERRTPRNCHQFHVPSFALQGSEYEVVLKNTIQREPDLLWVADVRKNDGSSWGCAGPASLLTRRVLVSQNISLCRGARV